MNLTKVKEEIFNKENKHCVFFVKGIRNQNEKFEGKIVKCFPSIFIIESSDGRVRSFSYNDYVIGNLKILA